MTAAPPAARNRPLILITADVQEDAAEPTERLCLIRHNYCAAILQAGGLPLILPLLPDAADAALGLAHGLLIAGTRPGEDAHPARRDFEITLIQKALERDLPLLGICNGMQLLGEVLGGTVDRGNPALHAETSLHVPAPVPSIPAHGLRVADGWRLASWADGAFPKVNSLHRHALLDRGRFRVLARAPDGVVEAIEAPDRFFCLGVQWHPKYLLSSLDTRILSEFVAAAARLMPRPRPGLLSDGKEATGATGSSGA